MKEAPSSIVALIVGTDGPTIIEMDVFLGVNRSLLWALAGLLPLSKLDLLL